MAERDPLESRRTPTPVNINLEDYWHGLYTMTHHLAILLETQAEALKTQSVQFERLWRAEQAQNDPARREGRGQAH